MDSTKPVESAEILAAVRPEFCTDLSSPILDAEHILRHSQSCARKLLHVLRAESSVAELDVAVVTFLVIFIQPMMTISLHGSSQFARALQILHVGIGDSWGWEEKDGTVHRYTPLEAAEWNDIRHILQQIVVLNQILSQPSPVRAARSAALQILGRTLLYLPLAPELLDALSDDDAVIREVTAESLLPIVKGIELYCLDENGEATQTAPPSLTEKKTRIIKALVETVDSASKSEIHGWLQDTLMQFGPEATAALGERLQDPLFGTPESRTAGFSLLRMLPS